MTVSCFISFPMPVYLSPYYNKVCMVFFHSVDIVKSIEEDRGAWQAKCYLPKTMFDKKTKKGMKKPKFINYNLFKRMVAVKEVVYARHHDMFRLYERYCHQASINTRYWGDDSGSDSAGEQDNDAVVSADDTCEADCDDGF